jgi:N-acetylglutamate synthase-like GNAT family acetyltransferase
MVLLRAATRADAWPIRKLIWRVGINPTGLDWRRFTLLVDETDRLLGCIQIKPHGDGSRELASLAVELACRGQGHARRLVEHMLARSQPPLYLTCARGLQPFYQRFGFRRLAADEMPPYLRRLHRLVNAVPGLLGRPDSMLVMRWDGGRAVGAAIYQASRMRA